MGENLPLIAVHCWLANLQAAWDFVRNNDGHTFELNVVNPSLVVGPLRGQQGSSAALIRHFLDGRLHALPPLMIGVVDVRDVAAAHIAAMTCAQSGELHVHGCTPHEA